MYVLLPYFWILLLVGLPIITGVAALLSRPKRAPVQKTVQEGDLEAVADPEPVLDFGDELAQMEQK
jgi:hypothetical protein